MPTDDAMATGNGDGAAPCPAPLSSVWTRRDEKLLEMLLWRWQLDPHWDRLATELGGKTATQVFDRYVCLADELRLVMAAPAVDTPPAWDVQDEQEAAVAPLPGLEADAAAGAGESAEVTAIGIAAAASPNAAATRAPTIGGGVELKSRELKNPRKTRIAGGGPRKKAEMWTREEHRYFTASLFRYYTRFLYWVYFFSKSVHNICIYDKCIPII
jgi:hypothetical protein